MAWTDKHRFLQWIPRPRCSQVLLVTLSLLIGLCLYLYFPVPTMEEARSGELSMNISGSADFIVPDAVSRALTALEEEAQADARVLPLLHLVLDRLDKGVDGQQIVEELTDLLGKTSPDHPCPEHPHGLIGPVGAKKIERTPDVLEWEFPTMKEGGSWAPEHCQPTQKLAIIIPYRNRRSHLLILLRHLIPILQRQLLDFTIFVIEQLPPTTFNRGMLMNIGFLEASKRGPYNCFIFHDVDMLPCNDMNIYRCDQDNPVHLPAGISKFGFQLPYQEYYGAVVAFTRDQFIQINGDSNLYFGWGGEDDDLLVRVMNQKYKLLRNPISFGKYDMIKHSRDNGNEENADRLHLLRSVKRRQHQEGLNTCVYHVASNCYRKLWSWISINIDVAEIIETAPFYLRPTLEKLLDHKSTVSR